MISAHGLTFNEHVNAAIAIAEHKRDTTSIPEAKRDLALSITAAEDALTRHNSACYRLKGTWGRADPDKQP